MLFRISLIAIILLTSCQTKYVTYRPQTVQQVTESGPARLLVQSPLCNQPDSLLEYVEAKASGSDKAMPAFLSKYTCVETPEELIVESLQSESLLKVNSTLTSNLLAEVYIGNNRFYTFAKNLDYKNVPAASPVGIAVRRAGLVPDVLESDSPGWTYLVHPYEESDHDSVKDAPQCSELKSVRLSDDGKNLRVDVDLQEKIPADTSLIVSLRFYLTDGGRLLYITTIQADEVKTLMALSRKNQNAIAQNLKKDDGLSVALSENRKVLSYILDRSKRLPKRDAQGRLLMDVATSWGSDTLQQADDVVPMYIKD